MNVRRLLLIEDDPAIAVSLTQLFASWGFTTLTAATLFEATRHIQERPPDMVLFDLDSGDDEVVAGLLQLRAAAPLAPILVGLSRSSAELTIRVLKAGAHDCLLKPFEDDALRQAVIEVAEAAVVLANRSAAAALPRGGAGNLCLGTSASMHQVFKLVGKVADTEATVLVRGESGTGKELVAMAIHRHSRRAEQSFAAINCAGIPEGLIDSALFGHEKGSYTGAHQRTRGLFERADGGTIFLDEVGDMPPSTQARLLRVLQERRFERVGGCETVEADVRFISATNAPLEAYVRAGRFREDLYYRLNVVTISIPPLRERKDDIHALVQHFVARFAQGAVHCSPRAIDALLSHDWPGNVRELEHCIQQAVLLCKCGVLLPEHLKLDSARTHRTEALPADGITLGQIARAHLRASPGEAHLKVIEQVERPLLEEALRQTQGNLAQAARLLGLSRPTLRERLRRFGLARSEVQADVEVFDPLAS